jgi:hypothetical protein
VFDAGASGLLGAIYDAGNWLHVETRESVIRRELLLKEGDCVDALRLSESARLLREFRFMESVEIQTTRRANGDVDVAVFTRDDWTLRLEPRFAFGGGFAISGIGLAERNIGGRGKTLELLYIDRDGRDDVGMGYFDPQFMSSRWNLAASGFRTAPGWTVDFSLAYPFVGLVGRWAAFQDALYSERWFRYVVGDSEDGPPQLLLPMAQKEFQLGGAVRAAAEARGRATKLGTYGLTVSYEYLAYGSGYLENLEAAENLGLSEPEARAEVAGVIRQRETLRLNLVVGVRGLEYQQRRGVTTMRAVEDIALGVTADLVLGLAARGFGTSDSHVLTALDLYGGSRVYRDWFTQLRLRGEARRDYEVLKWNDIFATLQWSNFWLVSRGNTLELSTLFSAGWETTVPFQLTLGGQWGLAGYGPDRYPGGARAVLRLEDRANFAKVGALFDLGSVVFVDAGGMWANDALFGTDSGLRASGGVGLRLAAPTGSRTTYRFQLAAPFESGVTWDEVIFSLRIERPLRLDEGPADLELARSTDVAVRAATRHLK